ncbi:hypothetical protein BFX06_05365 [Sulfobacillus thermosulfidooxidans]|nr:hypothetical protein BFX05_15040 [Sulfobacillus thermosulfidooxidans]OLZ14733.1 hypothetical protein BFX06_05365 [Sulfobacillus thermosulfidooxidans]OLZ22123.1 hypothetical protein BFX07_11005 [Sulfobacillus thermosulfidooxidans]
MPAPAPIMDYIGASRLFRTPEKCIHNNNLLTFGEELSDKTRAFVTVWSQSPEDRHKYQFEMFVHGLKWLSSYKEAMYLATGYGPILHHHIVDFINELGSIDN